MANLFKNAKSALPTHLKPESAEGPDFARKHHGKTQSHMVSASKSSYMFWGGMESFGEQIVWRRLVLELSSEALRKGRNIKYKSRQT